jgi:hypothetical protein
MARRSATPPTTIEIIREAAMKWDVTWVNKYPSICPLGIMCIWEYMMRQRLKNGYHPSQRILVQSATLMPSQYHEAEGYPYCHNHTLAVRFRKDTMLNGLANPGAIVRIYAANERYGGSLYSNRHAILTSTECRIIASNQLQALNLPDLTQLHELRQHIAEQQQQLAEQEQQCAQHAAAQRRRLRRINIHNGKP